MRKKNKLLVVDVAALGWDVVSRTPPESDLLRFRKTESILPAVTCSVQASFRTASAPADHGMVANGLFFSELRKVLFWEQSAQLVSGERIWKKFRDKGRTVGIMFWQQSLGEDVDLVLSPQPIHKHSGGMIQDCYSLPRDLFPRLVSKVGKFNLMHYWGPLASRKSSDFIVGATKAVMRMEDAAPDLLFTYLPHLDYNMQRHGPQSPKAQQDLKLLYGYLDELYRVAAELGYEILVFGDYAIGEARGGAVFPNRALRENGLLPVRIIRNMAYPDFFRFGAFAMVDHEVAHVYCAAGAETAEARQVLEALPGVHEVLDKKAQKARGIAHDRSGDLVLVAAPGHWFAYPWWTDRKEAPDYATHVDIHNKPGFDPCELFFGWPPPSVSMNTAKIKGSHGRPGSGAEVAWASTIDFGREPKDLVELSGLVKKWLDAAG